MTRITLQPDKWYACEFIGDEFRSKDNCAYSPIKVYGVKPCAGGERVFELSFYHALYPEGVRDKVYRLQTIHRGESLILARSLDHKPCRMLQIYEITNEWVQDHCSLPEPIHGDVQEYLNRHA